MTEKQEPLQQGVKTEGSSSNDGIEGNCYEQNGKFGIGEMRGGEIKDLAKVAGTINEAPSNKIEIHITNHSSHPKIDSPQPSNSDKTDRNRDCDETDDTSVIFSVVGSVEQINAKKLKSILLLLQKLSGDATIIYDDIELGSIRLILSGSQKGLKRIKALFRSGELSEVLDIPVEDVRFIIPNISENSEGTTTTERKRLAFTIAGNIDEADLAKLKAAVVDNSNSGEQAKIDRKSRLIQEIITSGGFRLNLSGADLSGADLSGADLSGADLRSADLSRANLSGADLSGADLSGADLSGADLSGADLSGADLSGADLRSADLSRANLSRANLSRAIIDTETKIDNKWRLVWEIVNQKAEARDLSGADLSGADLSGADLSGADLRNADMSGADLSGADLRGAYLSRAYLSRAYLSGAILSGAILSGADLSGADLSGAILSGAILSGADLSGTNVENARFGYNSGISEPMKQDLIKKGAIFEDSPGDRSSILVPR